MEIGDFAKAWAGDVVCGEGWLDRAIDPENFLAHPTIQRLLAGRDIGAMRSFDDAVDLDRWLPGVIHILSVAYADEAPAWRALEGRSSEEYPLRDLYERAQHFVLAPFVVRRIATQLDFSMPFQRKETWGEDLSGVRASLEAADVYPGGWDEAAVEEVKTAYYRLNYEVRRAARTGEGLVVDYG